MSLALFSDASNWVINAYGECSGETLQEVVNAIRQMFYSWYAEMDVIPLVEECFEVQTYCENCNRCQDSYSGVTLPRGYGTPEAMWLNSRPVQLFDRWRQWHTGITSACDCGLKSYEMGHDYPTERDLRQAAYVVATVMRPDDTGKKLIIRGTQLGGHPFEEELILGTGGVRTKLPLIGINRTGGIVKDETLGGIVLSEESGRVLSIYAPDERIPAYTRLKITGLQHGESCQYINIRSNRSYYPLHDPFDVVECGNRLVWESMARYLRINRKTLKNGEELKSMAVDLTQAKALLLGDKSRETGKSTQAQLAIRSPGSLAHSRIIGRRRRF